jgi:hypothetical protein
MDQINQSFASASAAGKYDVVYLNTPWKKLTSSDLAALPIADLCKPDATLFMWADSFTVADATDLISKYGFEFKSVASVLNLAEKPAAPAPVIKKEETEPTDDPSATPSTSDAAAPPVAGTAVIDVTGTVPEESSVPSKPASKPRGPRVKSIQPPAWWATGDCISRPTTELLFMAVRGAGAPVHPKYKAQPYQVADMPELAKSKARDRQPSAWCPEEWFFRRPSEFLQTVVHSVAPDSRIIELFGDTLHDTVHALSPGVPLSYVPALASDEGIVAVAKNALDGEGKVALRSLAAKLRRLLTAAPPAAPEDGEVVPAPEPMDDSIKAALAKASAADQGDWSNSVDLQRIFSSCADYKLANHSSRSRKHKRTPRNKLNADGTPVQRYGIAAPTPISPELCAFLGEPEGTEIARTTVVKRINAYIKQYDLKDGRKLKMDQKMKDLLKPAEGEDVTYFTVCKLISPHILKKRKAECSEEPAVKKAKKSKQEDAAAPVAAVAA